MDHTTCPACQGDGWGIQEDGFIIVQTEGGCIACDGTGEVTPERLNRAEALARGYEKKGWI